MQMIRALVAVLAALLAASMAAAGAPYLVRDINPTIIAVDSNPSEIIDQGSWSLFEASDGVHHGGPWATDGTMAGTVDLGSVTPFDNSQSGTRTVRVGGYTYLFRSGVHLQPVLYRLDGTAAGTRVVKDFWEIGDNAEIIGALGNAVIFSLFETSRGREFWRSDGTEAGTFRITDVGGQDGYSTTPYIVNGKLYFLSLDFGTNIVEPWVTDGTAAGTHRLAQLPNASALQSFAAIGRVGNYLLFTGSTSTEGSELWRIDLATDSVSLLKDIAPGDATGVTDGRLGMLGNVAVFLASTTDGGTQTLWRTDGTSAGTYQVNGGITPMNDAPTFYESSTTHRMLFRVLVGNDVTQLWSTDGSTAQQLAPPGPVWIGTVAGNVYFYSGPGGVWRSDGTPAGTKQLIALPANPGNVSVTGSDTQFFIRTTGPGTMSGYSTIYQWSYNLSNDSAVLLRSHPLPGGSFWPNLFGYAQGKLYFDSVDAATGREIYVSDGTPAGTRLVRNIAPETRTQSSDPRDLFKFNDTLFFTADDGVSGRELWRVGGGRSMQMYDLNPGPASSNPLSFFTLGNKLYFFALDAGTNNNGYKLYTTDGVLAPTPVTGAIPRELLSFGQGPCGNTVAELGGYAYLSLYELGFTTSLWRTDGTAGGTTRFQDLTNNIDDPCWLTVFKNKIYFSGRQYSTVGTELFSAVPGSIPTLAVELVPGTQGSQPEELTVFNNRLYFRAITSAGFRLYSTDGVASGATLLYAGGGFPNNLKVANSKLFFLSDSPGVGSVGLFAGDGTTAGTARVGTVGVGSPLHSNGARVFFGAVGSGVPFNTTEPWVSDGTVGGTLSLASGGFPTARQVLFWDFNGSTIIQAAQANGETQLWRTDGTRAGTRLVGDAGVVAQNHYPAKHMAAGQTFYFVSDKGGSGTELFAVTNEQPVPVPDAAGSVQAGVALAINVTANDTDPDGSVNPASVNPESLPAHGSITVSSTGVVTYTAVSTYVGTDSFSYSVADDQGARSTQTALVTVTVTAPPPSGGGGGGDGGGGGGGGGGGAIGLLELLCLAALLSMAGTRRRA